MTALSDAVETTTADVPRFYPINDVPPGKPTYPYGTFSAVLGGGDVYTLDSAHGIRHGLVSVQTFGKTLDSATDHMEKVVAALLDQRLDLAGRFTTPLRAALDRPAVGRDPNDNGVVTVTAPFNFTIAREA